MITDGDPLRSAREFLADPGLVLVVGLPPNALMQAWSPRWGLRLGLVNDLRALREEVLFPRPRPAEAADDDGGDEW